MISGTFRFILAVITFIIIGVVINPVVSAIFNGTTLPPLGILICQILAAGFVVAK